MLDLSPKKRDKITFGNDNFIAERFITDNKQKEKNDGRGSTYNR